MQDWLSVRNIKASSLALLLFLYPILVLSIASVRYTETIHRVTLGQTFDENLFGSPSADSLAALAFLLFYVGLTFQSTRIRLLSIAVFTAGIALYVASPDLMKVVGIATLPALVISLLTFTLASRKQKRTDQPSFFRPVRFQIDASRVAGAFLVIIIILEIGALARWITYPFFPTEIYSDPSWSFAALESALFHSLGLLSSLLVVLIAFSFAYKWYVLDVLERIRQALQGSRHYTSGMSKASGKAQDVKSLQSDAKRHQEDEKFAQEPKADPSGVVATYATKSSRKLTKYGHWMILSAALVIAPLLMIYPHLPGINPLGSGVSTDEQYYMNWLSQFQTTSSSTWTDIIARSFTVGLGDRPFTLLLILSIANLTGSPELMVIRFLPVALAPALVMTNYLFIKHCLRSNDIQRKIKLYASIGAIISVFSPQMVVGEYAGLLANWLGLIVAYFALLFLIKAWESKNRSEALFRFSMIFALLSVMMFIHLYTWAYMLPLLLLFAGLSYLSTRKSIWKPRTKLILIVAIVGITFLIDYARSSYFLTPASTESGSAIVKNILPQDINARWERLYFTMSTYVGGFLSVPILLLLGLVWIVKADISKGFDRLILSMFFIVAIPIAFGSIEFQTRVLYNTPFHLAALLAIYGCMTPRDSANKPLRIIAIIVIILGLAVYSMHAMANLYLQLPEGYVLDEQFLLS